MPGLAAASAGAVAAAAVPLPFPLLSPAATNYLGGMRALRDMPAVLSPEQAGALRDMLAVPHDPRMTVPPAEFNAVKNAAAEFLLQQPAFPADLLFDFAAMFEDPVYDAVWRDYCLQMLGHGCLGLSGRVGQDSADARTLAVSVLLEAAETRLGTTWAGTALLGLHAVMASDPGAVPAETFTNRVVGAASDASAPEAVRITALRLAGACRMDGALPAARELAGTAATGTLRAAAAATLGELGEAGDRALLAALASDDDPAVSAAAKHARSLIDKALAGGKQE